jgi:hypothetical protein
MQVTVEAFTKDLEAALKAFKVAAKENASDCVLSAVENWSSKDLECFTLAFAADHRSKAVSQLDDGPFFKDKDDL